MKTLDNFLGRIERFIGEYSQYLSAKRTVKKYNRGQKQYDKLGFEIRSSEIIDAEVTISLWKK